MAFKTKEEMFGDGAGYGAVVPYSTANAAGTGTGNRGIAFGEQLTAAIANRPHYALALNDEDLNARLAAMEVGGLDAAYDNGETITADSGAVVVTTTRATDYAYDVLNALYRADAGPDTKETSVGYDFIGPGFSGFLARQPYDISSNKYSTLSSNQLAATMNPGGALGTTFELGVGEDLHDGAGGSDLWVGYDLVEVTGTASSDGVYLLSGFGALTQRGTLTRLDGSSPAFTTSEAATVKFWRPTFSAGQFSGARTDGHTGLVLGPHGDAVSGITLISKAGTAASGDTRAPDTMLRLLANDPQDGSQDRDAMLVDWTGAHFFEQHQSVLPQHAYGNAAGRQLNGFFNTYISPDGATANTNPVVDLFQGGRVDADGASSAAAMTYFERMSARPMSLSALGGTETLTITFTATQGELEFTSLQTLSAIVGTLPAHGTILISDDAGTPAANKGVFIVVGANATGNGRVVLRKLSDYGLPAAWTAGNYPVKALRVVDLQGQSIGRAALNGADVLGATSFSANAGIRVKNDLVSIDSDIRLFDARAATTGADHLYETVLLDASSGDIKIRGALTGNVVFTPSGNLEATTVAGAITELDGEKAGLALSNVFTGTTNTFRNKVLFDQASGWAEFSVKRSSAGSPHIRFPSDTTDWVVALDSAYNGTGRARLASQDSVSGSTLALTRNVTRYSGSYHKDVAASAVALLASTVAAANSGTRFSFLKDTTLSTDIASFAHDLHIDPQNWTAGYTTNTNTLYPNSIVKAYCNAKTDGSGGVSFVGERLNCASVSIVGGDVVVTFAAAMAVGTNPCAVVSFNYLDGTLPAVPVDTGADIVVLETSPASITVRMRNSSDIQIDAASTGDVHFSLIVLGSQ